MKFFIDTADIEEIRLAHKMARIDGVTTNPSLVVKVKKPFHEIIKEICKEVPGPVSAEVISLQVDEMVAEGRQLAKIADNVVVKVPLTDDGLMAVKKFTAEGIKTNVTLCFSPLQALLAAKAGASMISPFVGRLDDIGQSGMDVVAQILQIYERYDFETEVLVASVRHPEHILQAAMMGAHIATVPFKTLAMLSQHPLTDKGLKTFLDDWAKATQK
jgi:transaldolase